MDELKLPGFNYYIDESDPDIVVLRRQDRAFVAAFSAQGATKEGILEAAKEDYGALVEANKDFLAPSGTLGPLRNRATKGCLTPRGGLFTRVRGREVLGSSAEDSSRIRRRLVIRQDGRECDAKPKGAS